MEPAIPYPLFLFFVIVVIGALVALLTAPLWARGIVYGTKLSRKSLQEADDTLNELKPKKPPIHITDSSHQEPPQ